MAGLKPRLLKRALPLVAALVAVVSVGARSARAQINVGCSLDYFPIAIPCSDHYANCHTYVPSVYVFGDCNYSAPCYGWESQMENDCCGQPILVYTLTGYCLLARPQLQAKLEKSADRPRVAKADDDVPPRKEPAGRPRLPQPIYLRECTGDYVLYVVPLPP